MAGYTSRYLLDRIARSLAAADAAAGPEARAAHLALAELYQDQWEAMRGKTVRSRRSVAAFSASADASAVAAE